MKLENEFTVNTPIDRVWEAMQDLEEVTPCLPGAQLTEQQGNEYKGTMTIKMGPVTQTYNGIVSIEDTDKENYRAVIKADGKDKRGQGGASATITSTLSEDGSDSTHVHVETDMHLSGKVAQFGRGVHKDVASKVMGKFADCLEQKL